MVHHVNGVLANHCGDIQEREFDRFDRRRRKGVHCDVGSDEFILNKRRKSELFGKEKGLKITFGLGLFLDLGD